MEKKAHNTFSKSASLKLLGSKDDKNYTFTFVIKHYYILPSIHHTYYFRWVPIVTKNLKSHIIFQQSSMG